MSIMSPEALVTLLAAYPYPGCIVTRPGGAVRLDFDGIALSYKADGWHFGDLHLESKLNHFAAEAAIAEIRRILKVVMSLKVERALNEAEADGTTDPVAYLTNLAAEKMLAILDVAALANARQAGIGRLAADLDAAHKQTAAAKERGEGCRNALDRIAGLAGIGSWGDPNAVCLVVKGMRTARDDARARITELEHDLACKDDAVKTAHAALTRICEVIGAPAPCVAEDAVEAVKAQLGDDNDANNRAQKAEVTIAEMVKALADAGAPQAYHLEDGTERPIPDPERIRLLGERIHTLRAQIREVSDATNYLNALIEAHNALDDRDAPRLADGCVLSLAARVRSLPR